MNAGLIAALARASDTSTINLDVPAFDADLFAIKLDDKGTWKPTAEEGWQGPMRKAPAIHAGQRFSRHDAERHANGAQVGKRNKLARKMMRKKLMKNRSTIERHLGNAHLAIARAEHLSDNVHEKQRILDEESALRLATFNERLAKWTWFRDWVTAWNDIGSAYGRLTVFARMGVK